MEKILQSLKANVKKWAILALIVVGGLFAFSCARKHAKKVDQATSSTVLGPNQQEKIVVNPEKHTITVTTKKSNGQTQTTTTYLPDRPVSITEDKNGKLSLVDKTWGTEVRPYGGFGGDFEGKARIHGGLDFFYIHRFDLGMGLAFNPTDLKDTRADLNLSYNFWSNTSIAFSLDNHKVPGIFLKVRF